MCAMMPWQRFELVEFTTKIMCKEFVLFCEGGRELSPEMRQV